MEILELIIKLGAAATGLAALLALVVAIFRVGRKVYSFLHSLEKNVNTLVKHDRDQYLAILRLTVTADHMPVSERLIAGKEYVELGGNGEVKKMYNELKRQCEEAIEE